MATNIDKQLFDDLVHNAIAVGRYSNQQAQDMVALLNKADADITAKLIKWGESGRYTPARLRAILAEIKLTLADTYGEASDSLKTEMMAFAEHSAEVAAATVATQMPLNRKPFGVTAEQMKAILSTEPIRIGANQALLFGDLFKSLSLAKEQKIRGAVQLGMVEGESIQQIVQRLTGTKANRFADGVNAVSRRDLYNITHSVVQHTSNQAAAAMMQNNSEVVKGFLSIVTLDSKSCMFCVNASYKEYKLTDTGPIWHIGCRCFRAPILRTWKELGFDREELKAGGRATSTGVVSSDISFNDWLKTAPVKTQIELLGPTRQKMFANGMKTDKFTDASGKLYTLEQLKAR